MSSAKSNGDNGHPCLVPLFKVKPVVILPFVVIDAEGFDPVYELWVKTKVV